MNTLRGRWPGLSVAVFFLLSLLSVEAGAQADGLHVVYQPETDTLTIEANQAELSQVLTQIGRQAKIRMLLDPDVHGNVSASYTRRPLADALAAILRNFNTVILYRKQVGNKDTQRVSEVRIFPRGKESNGMLKSLVELEQDDQRQQRVSRRDVNKPIREERRKEKRARKYKARMQRIESLKKSDPERYAKIMERIRKREATLKDR